MLTRYGGVLLALFAAAIGYGTLVPLVPLYLGASGGGDVAWHSGALPAAFLAAASVSAPLWGHLSDRIGRRAVIMSGSAGEVLAVIPFLLKHDLAQLYVFQALAGFSFGAVTPSALALLYEAGDPQSRARRIAWFGAATLGGYLLGPALGGWLASLANGPGAITVHHALQLALGLQSSAAAVAVFTVYMGTVSVATWRAGPTEDNPETARAGEALASLLAAMLASLMLGGFEIATVLHLRGLRGFSSREVASLFIACSSAMAVAQLVFLPRLSRHFPRVYSALLIIALTGIMLGTMPLARSFAATISLGALIGGGLGLALGVLGLQMAAAAGARRGLALGAQNAAMNAGQAAGSIAGSTLFAGFGENALPGLGMALIVLALLLAVATFRLPAFGATRSRLDPHQ